jgi:carboxyl-terminal processing protease
LMTRLRQRTDITLNEKLRKQEREDNETERLAIENKRRKAKGMTLLNELKSDSDIGDTKHGREQKNSEKDNDKSIDNEISKDNSKNNNIKVGDDKKLADQEEPDALLFETGNILTDLMSLNEKTVAKQQ